MLAEEGALTGPAGEMTAIMSLCMLSIFDGEERTRAEFTELLAAAGFAIADVTLLGQRLSAIAAILAGLDPDRGRAARPSGVQPTSPPRP